MIRRLLAIALFGAVLLGASPAHAATAQRWVVVSDVHFDPFSVPRLVDRLNAAPADRWRGIFLSAGAAPFASYGSDTNFSLLESALTGMKTEDSNPAVVIVAGDFLAHGFRDTFQRVEKTQDESVYDAFVDKTIAFLGSEFRATFPHAHVLPVIGNNDGYCGDYRSTPNSAFLLHMAQAWLTAVDPADAPVWVAQFAAGGYYTVPLPAAGANAVVLNDVFWTPKYANACGAPSSDPGGDELTWLRSTLAQQHAPVWLIAHVPPGVDAYATLQGVAHGSNDVTMMIAPKYNDVLLSLASDPHANITAAIAGHTHMDSFRIISSGATPVVPMLLVPSISPVFGNTPSFTTLDVDNETAAIDDERVFVLDDFTALAKDGARPSHWVREYDFDRVFGHGAIDAAHLDRVQQAMFGDDRLRARFEQYYEGGSGRIPIDETAWRMYWCSNVALTATAFAACAMPQVQQSSPPRPSPPPYAGQ